MAALWDTNIAITSAVSALTRGFGDLGILLIVDKATNSLNSVTGTVTYTLLSQAAADATSGYISAGTLAAITAFFAQVPHATEIKVANWDLVAPETAAACLSRIQAIDNDWYFVLTNQRGDTNMLAMATAVNALGSDAETGMKYFLGQSASAFNTGTYPSALTSLQTMTRTAVVYHETTTVWCELAWVAKVASWNQSEISPGWMWVNLDSTTVPTLTPAGLGYCKTNNANVAAPAGGYACVMGQGYGTDGTPIKSRVTADILTKTMRSTILDGLVYLATEKGVVVGVDEQGKSTILGWIAAVISNLTNAGHFEPGQSVLLAQAISSADRTARRLRFDTTEQLVEQLVTATIANYLTPSPVV
jgi:hypothetical protein